MTTKTSELISVCPRCGYEPKVAARFCRRCGQPFDARSAATPWRECHICYAQSEGDGLFRDRRGGRLTFEEHVAEHARRPIGDDEYLESLRDGEFIHVGRWRAPFEQTRRYLVTGYYDGGWRRGAEHNALVTAMTYLSRGGGALPGNELSEARAALEAVMERYHR